MHNTNIILLGHNQAYDKKSEERITRERLTPSLQIQPVAHIKQKVTLAAYNSIHVAYSIDSSRVLVENLQKEYLSFHT